MSSFASTSSSRRCELLSNGNSCALCRWANKLKEGAQEVALYGLRLIIHAAPSTELINKHGLHAIVSEHIKDEEEQGKFFEMCEQVSDREAWGRKLLAAEQRRLRNLKAEKAERAARARREQQERERQEQEEEQEEPEQVEQENEPPAASTPTTSKGRAVSAPVDWAPRRSSVGAGASRKKLLKARRTSMKVRKELAGEPSEPRRMSTRARRAAKVFDPSN